MAEFHKLLARIKGVLETPAASPAHGHPAAPPPPVAPIAQRAEMISSFGRELEAVGGKFLGTLKLDEAAAQVAALARQIGAQRAAVGEGIATKMSVFTAALEGAGCSVLKPGATPGLSREATIEQLSRCDLSVAEAHYAIASTGTIAVASADARPASLTLLPPACVVIIQIERLVADLAGAIASLGAEAFVSSRVTMITGPSRTADIEKRLVVGVHGPKHLYSAIIWPDHE